jgi:NADH-quinone oxidoreductase subunit J
VSFPISAPFFYLFAGLAIAFSLAVVFHRNPVSSAFSLVMVFFSFAGIYALLDAHLVATLQVLVYAGAIMVLFVFVIMLLNADAPTFDFGRAHAALRFGAISGCAVLLTALVWCFKNSPLPAPAGQLSPEAIAELGGNTQVLAQQLFSQYLLPFELTSALLLAGLVGTVAIAKRKLANGAEANQ